MLYLDYAATTPVRPEVKQEMEYYFDRQFANPHSPHDQARAAKAAVEGARRRIADVLGVWPRQLIFTSGGTESNNLAILGVARARKAVGRRLLTTPIEHKSVLGPLQALEQEGFRVDFLPVDSTGLVKLDRLEEMVTPNTLLVSVGQANNEIGTVQPVTEIAKVVKSKGVLLHCDCVQSFGKIPLKPKEWGIDLLSVSGHKIYAPKGIGLLYVASKVRLEPLFYGGSQEGSLRPGTLNVPAIMGLAKAVELIAAEQEEEGRRQRDLRDLLITSALQIKGVYLNGPREQRLPNHVSLGVRGVEGQVIVAELARRGIAVSTGAACSSGSQKPSHVLVALGQEQAQAFEGFRITLGRDTTQQDILRFAANLSQVIEELAASFDRCQSFS